MLEVTVIVWEIMYNTVLKKRKRKAAVGRI